MFVDHSQLQEMIVTLVNENWEEMGPVNLWSWKEKGRAAIK